MAPKKGQEEAHTRGAAGVAELERAVDQLAGDLAARGAVDPDAEQLDLLDGSPDLDPTDMLGQAANTVLKQRRERGRPKGSANKRNTAVFEYLEAMGHRDPAVTLSLIQSADTKELAKLLCAPPADVLKIQAKAAADLMPFKYAKKTEIVGTGGKALPVMVIGEMNVAIASDSGMMSAGEPPTEIVEFQRVSGSDAVRNSDEHSHETDK